MQPLDKLLRNKLERTVKEARDIAEDAARIAVRQLGVGEAAPYGHLCESDRELRRRLRIHGRQLGDQRHPETKTQDIGLLVEEVAYEHWHRMLFARFLAENDLLMYPDPDEPVAITLEECQDLAADEGARNGWELASRFASEMLPQIFRTDSPVFRLVLPPEHQQNLERLLDGLPTVMFTASDSLGWVYQFWQALKKDEVNASGVKIGARELPAVTQLFTEPYMVSFLLDNSLGAWWAARRLSEEDLKTAETEADLRQKASLPGVPLAYLRFIREGDSWIPAAGRFDQWPEHLGELKILDPCCGSGHFLVAAFLMLVPMRMASEGLSARDAADAVLRDNLHGLEIDRRCVELAAFSLAMAAWRYPDSGYRILPDLNLACSGLSVSESKKEWEALANGGVRMRMALGTLYDQFRDAPVLGSLIHPGKSGAASILEPSELADKLENALDKERTDEEHEAGVVARGLAKAARMLTGKYHWVITNVPYLTRGKQEEKLRKFCGKYYPEAKNDLATVFLDRCLEFCVAHGTVSVVLPQNWLFLTSYKQFREKLLKHEVWHLIARLGPGAFDTISGEVVKAILISLSRGKIAVFDQARDDDSANVISGIDVSQYRTPEEKATKLLTHEIKQVGQKKQVENPDFRVALENVSFEKCLGNYCSSIEGLTTGDLERFVKKYWEQGKLLSGWEYYIQNVDSTTFFGGRSDILFWESGQGLIKSFPTAHNFPSRIMNGKEILGKNGLRITQMSSLPITLYTGEIFGKSGATVIPDDISHLPAIWCFCSSSEYNKAVRRIDQKMNVTNATLVKVPFDLAHWTKVAEEKYPDGLPKPYSDDPTQWIFHGHPAKSDDPLQTAVARLLGYRWPAERDKDMELADFQREWVGKCEGLLVHADKDGIVCIPSVGGEASAADRLLNLLADAHGDDWGAGRLSELLKQAGHAGKTLESWLRDKFFIQHCKRFHHRPFIWQVWDGLRDGFSVLINYHKLDYKNLETLIYTYLGDWINRRKNDLENGVDGAEEKLAAAENLKKKLELILAGESPHDIFVRWKPIEKQPIGWHPDLNDGVRLNIRPFMTVGDVGKKGAGILREKPNIQWNKDRGKDVPSAPWYHLGPEYGGNEGDRINDHHLNVAEKRANGVQKLAFAGKSELLHSGSMS